MVKHSTFMKATRSHSEDYRNRGNSMHMYTREDILSEKQDNSSASCIRAHFFSQERKCVLSAYDAPSCVPFIDCL